MSQIRFVILLCICGLLLVNCRKSNDFAVEVGFSGIMNSNCRFSEVEWSDCNCSGSNKNYRIGKRSILEDDGSCYGVMEVKVPCDPATCNKVLVGSSNSIKCPIYFNTINSCDDTVLLATYQTTTFNKCNIQCKSTIGCTFFSFTLESFKCEIFSGNKICGETKLGVKTGIVGLSDYQCTECDVGLWSSFTSCEQNNCNYSMVRIREVNGIYKDLCPPKNEAWSCGNNCTGGGGGGGGGDDGDNGGGGDDGDEDGNNGDNKNYDTIFIDSNSYILIAGGAATAILIIALVLGFSSTARSYVMNQEQPDQLDSETIVEDMLDENLSDVEFDVDLDGNETESFTIT